MLSDITICIKTHNLEKEESKDSPHLPDRPGNHLEEASTIVVNWRCLAMHDP